MTVGWIFALVFASALTLTGLVRRYALARQLVDFPNERSSHVIPTPRGGGIAIVLSTLVGMLLIWHAGLLPGIGLVALFGAGALVAFVGFIDDHGHVPVEWRLLAHFVAGAWLLYWLGGLPPVELFGFRIFSGWLLQPFALLYLVWLLNLYNFMDGIDGLAAVEAISVCVGGALLYVFRADASLAAAPLLLAVAVLGFLFWNFPPARIFMGDAGSGFLGIVLGGLSIQAASIDASFLFGWLILLGVFIVDSSVTLLRRLLRGDRVFEAHRLHAYQRAALRFGSHKFVTLVIGSINLAWLLPMALWVASGGLEGMVGLLMAYAPLMVVALVFRAGATEDTLA